MLSVRTWHINSKEGYRDLKIYQSDLDLFPQKEYNENRNYSRKYLIGLLGLSLYGMNCLVKNISYWVCIDFDSWKGYIGGCCDNLALNSSKDEATTSSLDKLFQCLTNLTIKIFFLISILALPYFCLKLFPIALSLHDGTKCPSSSFLLALFQSWNAAIRSPQSFLLPRMNNLSSLSLFCCGIVFFHKPIVFLTDSQKQWLPQTRLTQAILPMLLNLIIL